MNTPLTPHCSQGWGLGVQTGLWSAWIVCVCLFTPSRLHHIQMMAPGACWVFRDTWLLSSGRVTCRLRRCLRVLQSVLRCECGEKHLALVFRLRTACAVSCRGERHECSSAGGRSVGGGVISGEAEHSSHFLLCTGRRAAAGLLLQRGWLPRLLPLHYTELP